MTRDLSIALAFIFVAAVLSPYAFILCLYWRDARNRKRTDQRIEALTKLLAYPPKGRIPTPTEELNALLRNAHTIHRQTHGEQS